MIKLSAKYMPTGRIVTGGDDHAKVNEWVKLITKDELLSHEVSKEFLNAISGLKPISGNGVFYRGRKFEKDFPGNSLQMGPPPDLNSILPDRYNNEKESVLYLADSVFGVQKELDTRTGDIMVSKICDSL